MSLTGLKVFFLNLPKAHGHAKLTTPQPRDPASNGGNKTGPCGPIAKSTTTVVTYNAGDNITVQWTETINHPGRFLFAISSNNDVSFQNFATYVDDQNTSGVHNYTATFKLPDVGCDNCTLQMIQSMEENPSAPTYYYSCSDIKIVKAAGNVATQPTSTASPTTGNNVSQSSLAGESSVSSVADGSKLGGGCGTVKVVSETSNQFEHENHLEFLMIFLLPLLIWYWLRRTTAEHTVNLRHDHRLPL